MKYLTATAFMILSFLFTSVAMAQSEDLIELAGPVLNAVLGGSYAYAAALALVLAVALLRRYGGAKWPILANKKAAPYLVLVASFGAALATSLSAGAAVSGALLWGAFKVAAGAGYGYALAKPLAAWLKSKSPKWLKPAFGLLDWVFTSRDRAEVAKAAGDKAVAESPTKGPSVEFKDIE